MADKMLRIAGRGEDGTAKGLKTDNAGSPIVKITGNPVEQLFILNGVSYTTTAIVPYSVDLSKYKSVRFAALNTHNQAIKISFNIYLAGYAFAYWNGSDWENYEITIPANTTQYLDINSYLPGLNDFFTGKGNAQIIIKPVVAPTSGLINLILEGVVR